MPQPKADPKAESSLENEEVQSCMAGRFCWKLWTSHLGLFIILIAYSFAGAGIMHAIEGYYAQQARMERNQSLHIVDFKQYFVNQTLQKWNGSEISTEIMYEFLEQYEQEKARYENNDISDYDYWDWLLFCLTVYTTIGYGVVTPATRPGRIATMAYATIGVPLFLMTMGKVGKLLTHGVKRFWSYVRRCFYLKQFRKVRRSKLVQKLTGSSKRKNEDVRSASTKDKNLLQVNNEDNTSFVSFEVDGEFDLHPLVAIIVTLMYIVFGSFMHVQWEEDWEYHDAFYFVFISISTIGFGDVHPQHPKFFLLSCAYILFGLALVAMVIDVLMDFYKETGQTVAERIDHLPEIFIGGDEDDEDKNNLKAGLGHLALGFQHQDVRRYSVL